MLKKPSKRTVSVWAAAAVAALVLVLWLMGELRSGHREISAITPAGEAAEISSRSDERAVRSRSERSGGEQLRYRESGEQRVVKLALDEVVLRDEDGKDRIARLEPPATPATLGKRLEELRAPNGVLPVAYVEGEERNDISRRLVTSEIRAKMPQEQAERLAKKHGLRINERPAYAPEWVIFSADRPLDALAKIEGLRGENSVESADVLLAVQREKKAMPNDTLIGEQWHLKASGTAVAGSDVNIEDAWRFGLTGGVLGSGVRIGIVDDGLQTAHPDLSANVDTANGKDWNGNDFDPNPGLDDDHGTACAGVAAAQGNNSLGVSGTAPQASLVGMRLIAAATTDQQEAEAMVYLPDLIPIKSNSWGVADTGRSLEQPGPLTRAAFANATTSGRGGRGSIIVFAGGNGGQSSVKDNSNYDGYSNSIHTIAVGATDSLGRRANYSEPGANLVVCAPSLGSGGTLGIVTTDRTGSNGFNTAFGTSGDYTESFNGTSASTPAVAGIVALMLEKKPALGWRDVQELLIRSARKISPGDADWQNNSAGFHFNHNFGAGLVDATAAVNMAATWTNLVAQTSVTSAQGNLSIAIPDNSATGITREFSLSSNLRVEHVTLKLSINHEARGELEISLTSPSGMVSRLAEVRPDTNPNYSNWTFSSVRKWGELAAGTWILKIADRSATNSTTGSLTAAELKIFGAAAAAVNPAPVVRITTPESGSTSSPGANLVVNVSAQDFNMNGQPSPVTEVQLFRNNILVETKTSTPYFFVLVPPPGLNVFEARAKDIEGKIGVSAVVMVTVVNQPPIVQTVTLSATGQAYADVALEAMVSASDPESDPITPSYQWQFSTDEEIYQDLAGATSAFLAASPGNAGKLWRCLVHASDGKATGEPKASAAVNVLTRPLANALPGAAYSYQSGLVLRSAGTKVFRQAILHEFSQGPAGGTAEWIEILTMKPGSLRKWTIRDAEGSTLRFRDSAVWDNIPAGTLVVVYDAASKDPLLPANNTSSSSGAMVLASNDSTYFDQALGMWPPLGNSGDSIFLSDGNGQTVHQLAYGNSTLASPNIGAVATGAAAYFIGDSDGGADVSGNWRVTTSTVARSIKEFPRQEKALNPAVVFSGGRYSQNFDTAPGPTGTSYPNGWTSFDQTSGSTINDETMAVSDGSTATGGNYNFGSRIGLLGSNANFDPGYIALALQDTAGLTGLKISYDVIKINEQGRNMQFDLQYTFAGPGNTGTVWNSIAGGSHSSGSSPTGTVTRYEDIALPAEFSNRSTPVYLRWFYRTSQSAPGTGGRDALALDNVLISSDQSPNISLSLTLNPTSISEAGGVSTGTITINKPVPTNLIIQLSSSDTTEAVVNPTVTLWANHSSTTFPIYGVDDDQSDGHQTVVITATAPGLPGVSASLIVLDNEPQINGVTPGKANTPSNETFITKLRTNALSDPPVFRLASGTSLPSGLTLSPSTGLISGTIASGTPLGPYTITIVLSNILGQTTSQTFTLNVTGPLPIDFFTWMADFGTEDDSPGGDPDFDGLPNLLEYALGTSPVEKEQAGPHLFEKTGGSFSIVYPRAKNRSDVGLFPEWSASLTEGSWQRSGITQTVLSDGPETQTIRASLPISPETPQCFLRLGAELLPASP